MPAGLPRRSTAKTGAARPLTAGDHLCGGQAGEPEHGAGEPDDVQEPPLPDGPAEAVQGQPLPGGAAEGPEQPLPGGAAEAVPGQPLPGGDSADGQPHQ